MSLSAAQSQLVAFYSLEGLPDVSGFLCDEAQALRWDPSARERGETLFLRSDPDGALSLSLFVRDDLQRDFSAWLVAPGPITPSRLHRLAAVIEGLSHFNLVAYRQLRAQPVSQLTLETQAYLDSLAFFLEVFASHVPRQAKTGQLLCDIRATLTRTPRWLDNSASSRRACYHRAHRQAAKLLYALPYAWRDCRTALRRLFYEGIDHHL